MADFMVSSLLEWWLARYSRLRHLALPTFCTFGRGVLLRGHSSVLARSLRC